MFQFDLFGYSFLPFESLRIGVAFLYLLVFSFFDLKYNKNIPDKIVYGLSAVAFLFIATYPNEIALYTLIQSAVVFAVCYLMYKAGQIGLAEAFSFSSLCALFPVPPEISGVFFNMPFIFFIFLFAGLVFSLFTVLFFLSKFREMPKFSIKELALVLVFLAFLFLYFQFPVANLVFLFIVSVFFLCSLFITLYKEKIMAWFVKKVKVENALEEVFAPQYATEKEKSILSSAKVITEKHIELLKKAKIKEVHVFGNMFPFSPFLLLGFVLALFLSANVLLF